jgi:hypothetical protein
MGPGHFTLKKGPAAHVIGGWAIPRVGPTAAEKGKIEPRSYTVGFYYLYCYMFRSYDHLLAEIYY